MATIYEKANAEHGTAVAINELPYGGYAVTVTDTDVNKVVGSRNFGTALKALRYAQACYVGDVLPGDYAPI